MDRLKDFFAEIKDRASNPLFASFVISWLVINWKIPVGLFCPVSILQKDGYNTYFQLIERNYSINKYILFPFLAALSYTFGFPVIRTWILAFQTKIKAWSTDWNLEIAKKGKISIERYIRLRQLYQDREQLVEQILKDEGQYFEENKQLKNEVLGMQTERNEARRQIATYENANKIEFINGTWKFYYHPNGETAAETLQIIGNNIHVLAANGTSELRYTITDYCCNPIMRTVVFRRTSPTQGDWTYHYLNYDINFTMLKGSENVHRQIRYKKLE